MKVLDLIKKAKEAQNFSFSPYSKFPVGAILEMKDGNLIKGANIENASYPLSCCAERVALFSARMKGYKKEDIVSLTIVANCDNYCFPCGACRQVISELMPKEAKIYCVNKNGEYLKLSIDDLLPHAFSDGDLK